METLLTIEPDDTPIVFYERGFKYHRIRKSFHHPERHTEDLIDRCKDQWQQARAYHFHREYGAVFGFAALGRPFPVEFIIDFPQPSRYSMDSMNCRETYFPPPASVSTSTAIESRRLELVACHNVA